MEKTIARNHNPHRTQSLFEAITRPTFSNVVGFIVLALLAMALMAPMSAMAQNADSSSGQFNFAPDSYFINVILQGILGTAIKPGGNAQTAGQVISAAGTNTLGEVFRQFNTGIAFFGSLMVVFTTIVGILQSGNDGEFLGRKWSSMWVPIRFATGSALMLPLTSSGYSYCQAVVLWIAGQGVGFADTLWSTIVAKLVVKDGMVMTAAIDMPTVTQTIAMAELCTAIVNSRNAAAGAGLVPIKRSEFEEDLGTSKSYQLIWQRPGGDGTRTSATCGSVSYSILTTGKLGSQNMSTDPYMYAREAMYKYHVDHLKPLAEKYADIATKIADKYSATAAEPSAPGAYDPSYDPMVKLNEIGSMTVSDAKTYVNEMGDLVTKALKDSGFKTTTTYGDGSKGSTALTEMSRYGFAMAGMWYMELLKAHSSARHTLTPPKSGMVNLDSLRSDPGFANFAEIYKDAEQVMKLSPAVASSDNPNSKSSQAATNAQGNIKTTSTSFKINTKDLIDTDEGPTKIMAGIMDWLREAIFGVGQTSGLQGMNAGWGSGKTNTVTNITGGKGRDPNVSVILQLKDKGDSILNATGVIMTLDILSKVNNGVFEAARGLDPAAIVLHGGSTLTMPWKNIASAVVERLSGYLMGAAVSLFLLGVMLSVYVPMMPYVLWVGALLGLVILILESLVAIMLWAVMMMHPSGEGITSDYNRQGLTMLLAVFTRPALLLMGMVLGMFMVEPMVMFVNDTFYVMMKSVQSNTITGLFQGIAFIAIYVSLIMMIVEKSFALIHVIPDRVLTWIGGPGALTGEEREITGRTQGMITGAGGAASTILLGRGLSGGGGRGQKPPTAPAGQKKTV